MNLSNIIRKVKDKCFWAEHAEMPGEFTPACSPNYQWTDDDDRAPKFCPECGRRVVVVERR